VAASRRPMKHTVAYERRLPAPLAQSLGASSTGARYRAPAACLLQAALLLACLTQPEPPPSKSFATPRLSWPLCIVLAPIHEDIALPHCPAACAHSVVLCGRACLNYYATNTKALLFKCRLAGLSTHSLRVTAAGLQYCGPSRSALLPQPGACAGSQQSCAVRSQCTRCLENRRPLAPSACC